MSNITEMQEQARKNAERATKVQNLRAMERLIVGMGGKHAYIAWLQELPEDVKLNSAGGLAQESVTAIAANATAYNAAAVSFARYMGPVLMALAQAEV